MVNEQTSMYDPVSLALAGGNLPIRPNEESVQRHTNDNDVNKAHALAETMLSGEPVETDDFSFQGYQVVRGEFFSHLREPSISFKNCKVSFNAVCFKRLPDVNTVQFLVNVETKKLVVRPCTEEERDCIAWCTAKRKARQISCNIFFAKIMALMEWNPEYRYKLMGKIISAGEEELLIFDLTATETFQLSAKDGEKAKLSKVPVYPQEWANQFGLPYEEHQKQLQVNLVDGYSVYSLTDKKQTIHT